MRTKTLHRQPDALRWVILVWLVAFWTSAARILTVEADSVIDADAVFTACEAALTADPEGESGCVCFYQTAIESGLQTEAIERLQPWLQDEGSACVALALGRLHLLRRSYQEAQPLLRHAARRYGELGQERGEVYARLNLVDTLTGLGAGGEELTTELDKARELATASGDVVLEAEIEIKQARLLLRRGGDVGWIEASLRQVRKTAFEAANPSLRRDILLTLGELLYSRGRFDEAETVFADMVDETTAAGDRFGEVNARLNRATATAARPPYPGQRQQVIEQLETVIDAAAVAENPLVEIEARRRLGRLLKGEAAREQLEIALAQARAWRERAPIVLASVLGTSALDMLTDQPEEARRRLDEAATLLLQADDPWAPLYSWSDHLRVLWATAPREEAIAAAQHRLAMVERLEQIQSTETARLEVSAVWTEIYRWLSGQLLAEVENGVGLSSGSSSDLAALAFDVSERMRARHLLESLSDGGVELPPANFESEPRSATWVTVQNGIVRLQRQLLDPHLDTDQRQLLLEELQQLELREDHLAAELRQPEDATLSRLDPAIDLARLQAGLTTEEAVLIFQTGQWQSLDGGFAGGSWLLTVSATETRVYRLPAAAQLDAAVGVFLHLFERPDSNEAIPAASLYEQLLAEALDALPAEARRLVVIPDGPLYRLPFAALRPTPEAPPLVTRYEIFLTPSVTTWLRLREAGASARHASAAGLPEAPILALADPRLELEGRETSSSSATTSRGWTRGLILPPLPYARREGRAVLRHLAGPGQLLLDHDASEATVKNLARQGLRLLHFGTHAVLDHRYPQRSAIVLAPGSAHEDGLLQPREVAALRLRGSVVVLAACQSAQGRVLEGEGALSLAHAFLQGGASAVVGSLWPLDDAEAAAVFDRFYHHLGRGASVAGALALAQSDRLEAGAPASAWAGLLVLGDGTVRIAPATSARDDSPWRPQSRRDWLLVTLLAVTLGAVATWWRQFFSQRGEQRRNRGRC